ncbi:MAG: hypothetical protein CMO60_06695 [Verrucomicrobiales bacterium]|nr:hypothetical protein [Verrucomicrobiales bacterium]
MVEELFSGGGEVDVFRRDREELGDAATTNGSEIGFAYATIGNIEGFRSVDAGGFENDFLSVGREGRRDVVLGMKGDTLGFTAFG